MRSRCEQQVSWGERHDVEEGQADGGAEDEEGGGRDEGRGVGGGGRGGRGGGEWRVVRCDSAEGARRGGGWMGDWGHIGA